MLQMTHKQYAISTEQLWNTLHEPLAAFIHKRVANNESAEDILQDVFLRIHMRIETLREEDKIQAWVYQIARNLIIDYYRRNTVGISLEDAELQLPIVEIPEEDTRAMLAPALITMMNSLPERDREALILTEYQGLSQRELATRLGLSFSGAKSRVQRAREKLKQMLLDCCHFEFDRLGRVIDYQAKSDCCVQDKCCLIQPG